MLSTKLSAAHALGVLLVGSMMGVPVDAAFEVKQHLGNLSPFFKPPITQGAGLSSTGGLGIGMPSGCELEQVQMMQRHASRLPLSNELPYIANLSTYLNSPSIASKLDSLKNLPDSWKFVQGSDRWSISPQMGINNLTAPGRGEAFMHGVQFRLAYPETPFKHILAGNQDRVIESAQWFRAGLFGRTEDQTSDVSLINEDNVTISHITPMNTCPQWQYTFGLNAVNAWGAVYLPRIQKRVNNVLKPVQLTADHIHGALYACAYELAEFGNTTWCGVFNQDEIEAFEYELDLLMRYAFGYGLPGDMGTVLGSVFANVLVDRLTNATAEKTYLDFGHDTTITIALTGLGLIHDTKYPTTGPVDPSRKWRTSYQVPFSAHMVWEKWACGASNTTTSHKPQNQTLVRMLLGGTPFSLSPLCPASALDKTTGACELNAFVNATAAVRSTKWGDAKWNATCNR